MKRIPRAHRARAILALALSICLCLSSSAGALAAFQPPPGSVEPITLKAVAGDKEVVLAWNEVEGAVAYNLYRATRSGAQGNIPYRSNLTPSELKSSRAGALTFTDKDLTNGTTYYYQVAAVFNPPPTLSGRVVGRQSGEIGVTPEGGGRGGGGIGKALLVLGIIIAVAALAKKPSRPQPADTSLGEKIARQAREARLETNKTVTGVIAGARITFTPADLSAVRSERELEEGRIIGLLDTEAKGDETPLPPGRYHLYLAKRNLQDRSDRRWHVYAASDAKIVAEAVRVRVEITDLPPTGGEEALPELVPQGWCWWQRHKIPGLNKWVWILHCW